MMTFKGYVVLGIRVQLFFYRICCRIGNREWSQKYIECYCNGLGKNIKTKTNKNIQQSKHKKISSKKSQILVKTLEQIIYLQTAVVIICYQNSIEPKE